MILETAGLIKIFAGVKVLAAHGGLVSTIGSQAVTTAGSAGVAAAAAQTVGTVAGVGAMAGVAGGIDKAIEGVDQGNLVKVAGGVARAVSGGCWIATH